MVGQIKNEYIDLKIYGTGNYKIKVFVCFPGRPRQATGVLQPAGLLYRPLWTLQLWPSDAPAL
jgi:hypothetical protein